MSHSSSTKSAWVVPFVLGCVVSLSTVWISQHWTSRNENKSCTRSTNRNKNSSSTTTSKRSKSQQQQQQQKVLDAPDLDHRMLRKCEAVLQWRTTRLILVIERCTNDHNYSAILRTAEALGIQTVFMIDPPVIIMDDDGNVIEQPQTQLQQQQQIIRTPHELEQRRLHHLFAQNATEWLDVQDFQTSEECVQEVRKRGYDLWVTDLSQQAVALPMRYENGNSTTSFQIPDKIALVMGTEAVGVSQYILEQADKRVYLPLRGFADSLNLSVATALIIHHLFLMDPSMIGDMEEHKRAQLRKAWYIKMAQQRLLSSSQKKIRTRLMGHIKRCEALWEKTKEDPTYKLQPGEKKKLDDWPKYQQELEEMDAIIDPVKVEAAIQEWLDHPPDPLTDLRRADNHRICFVGKNTRNLHKDHWKDMVATSNLGSVHGVTAMAFRDKMSDVTTAASFYGESTKYPQRRSQASKSFCFEKHFLSKK